MYVQIFQYLRLQTTLTKEFFLCLALYDIMTVDIPNMVISHWPHLLASTKLCVLFAKGSEEEFGGI